MKILALDASTEALSVAFLDSEQPDQAREHFEIAPRAHASRLLPVVQALLAEQGLRLANLTAIAFGRGPGAFTGLRIAAGLVQGLAAGAGCVVVPVSTLQSLASRALSIDSHAQRARVVTDARMGEIYTAEWARDRSMPRLLEPERVIRPALLDWRDAAADIAYAGNGWSFVDEAIEAQVVAAGCVFPHALDMARLAIPLIEHGAAVSPAQAQPVYVRDDVARRPTAPAAAGS
ncbi:MAG: tRNA (adenosine(37)-N6)-threonylcarbamoyltransferase complex dimerization subunit type 1 TsaB [Salinisphaera sp.]|jgi:tRNA threonylcarbamoyladenosine biosynthesis protein TsaB|nr:tRNA (adenosine(37)-N6)-threonylcarbamoyltransferase complex dimerization subunit type 1 TsaB [Salinisphaera sp.]